MPLAFLVEGDVNNSCMIADFREARSRLVDGAVSLRLGHRVVRNDALSVACTRVTSVGERNGHDLRAVYRVSVGLSQVLTGIQGDEQRVDVDCRRM